MKKLLCLIGFHVPEESGYITWSGHNLTLHKYTVKKCKECHKYLSRWEPSIIGHAIRHGDNRCLVCPWEFLWHPIGANGKPDTSVILCGYEGVHHEGIEGMLKAQEIERLQGMHI